MLEAFFDLLFFSVTAYNYLYIQRKALGLVMRNKGLLLVLGACSSYVSDPILLQAILDRNHKIWSCNGRKWPKICQTALFTKILVLKTPIPLFVISIGI